MTEHLYNGLNLGIFVFCDINQERQSWKCFAQVCNRSLVVFCPNFVQSLFFVICLFLAYRILRVILLKTWEETTVWIFILSCTVGYILSSAKVCTK